MYVIDRHEESYVTCGDIGHRVGSVFPLELYGVKVFMKCWDAGDNVLASEAR